MWWELGGISASRPGSTIPLTANSSLACHSFVYFGLLVHSFSCAFCQFVELCTSAPAPAHLQRITGDRVTATVSCENAASESHRRLHKFEGDSSVIIIPMACFVRFNTYLFVLTHPAPHGCVFHALRCVPSRICMDHVYARCVHVYAWTHRNAPKTHPCGARVTLEGVFRITRSGEGMF